MVFCTANRWSISTTHFGLATEVFPSCSSTSMAFSSSSPVLSSTPSLFLSSTSSLSLPPGGGLNVRHVSYPTSSSVGSSKGGVQQTGAIVTGSFPSALLEWESRSTEWEWGTTFWDSDSVPLVRGWCERWRLGLGGGGRRNTTGFAAGWKSISLLL